MVALKSWMKAKKMTKRHRMKILAHFNTQEVNRTFLSEDDILASLPPTLSTELSFFMYKSIIEKVPLFKGLGQEVMCHLCQLFKNMRVFKDQWIYEEGSVGSTMFVIIDGEVEVSFRGQRLGFLGPGAFFGETPLIEIVTEKGGDGTEVRSRSVAAVVETNLGFIESSDIEEALDKYPELKIRLKAFEKTGKKLGDKGNNKCEMAKMKVASLMKTAKKADSDDRLVQRHRYDDALQLAEEATVSMEDARRRGTNADHALDLWGQTTRALEDALGITLHKLSLIKLIQAANKNSGRIGHSTEDLLQLPIRTLEKEAVDAGVKRDKIEAEWNSARHQVGTEVRHKQPLHSPPNPPSGGLGPSPRKHSARRAGAEEGINDTTKIIRLLRDMQTTQDKLLATQDELLADVQKLKRK